MESVAFNRTLAQPLAHSHIDTMAFLAETLVCKRSVFARWVMNKVAHILVLLTPFLAVSGCSEAPPPLASYSSDVRPFIDKYCMRCHSEDGEGSAASGFRMDTYESLMKGTKYGAVIKPEDSFSSALVMLVEGRVDPSISMPHGEGPAPTQAEIDVVKAWIDQGAKNN
ncbi:MAG: c-type cytochrome domain-containing protein [Sedimenticolaceae bacterium]